MLEIDPGQYLKIFLLKYLLNLAFFLHEKRCRGAIARSSDNSSCNWAFIQIYDLNYIVGVQKDPPPPRKVGLVI